MAGDLSSDWPGYFAARVAAQGGGTGIFLVGDNGSEEDPITVPEQGGEGTYAQAQATGEALADATLSRGERRQRAVRPAPIDDGAARLLRPAREQPVPAAAAVGLFGDRQTYVVQGGQCVAAAGKAPDGLLTTVGVVDIGARPAAAC